MTKYERYQLQWMIDHNHSLSEMMGIIGNTANEELSQGGSYQNALIIDEAFSIFESERGFTGSEIWLSEEEFNGQDKGDFQ